jgi:glucokinase
LGVSGLLPNGAGGWVPIQGEGGHVTLPALTERERLVARGLAKKYTHASAERAVSGQGLVDLFHLLCAADQVGIQAVEKPSDVTQLAHQGHAHAVESIQMLTAFLGTVAGNLALTLGAKGGVYIGGGVVPKLGPLFDAALFRHRFESKGRFTKYMADIPVWLISSDPSPALEGAACVANQLG